MQKIIFNKTIKKIIFDMQEIISNNLLNAGLKQYKT